VTFGVHLTTLSFTLYAGFTHLRKEKVVAAEEQEQEEDIPIHPHNI
jgi:hypothetical protein